MKNRLRGLRKGKDLNQTQIAAVLRISQRGYSKYETGENKIPPEVLLRLADFYGVSVDYLLGRDETPAAQPPRGGSGRLQLAALRREHGMTQGANAPCRCLWRSSWRIFTALPWTGWPAGGKRRAKTFPCQPERYPVYWYYVILGFCAPVQLLGTAGAAGMAVFAVC